MAEKKKTRKYRADRQRKTVAEMNADGQYQIIEPLDYLILEQLQDEGTLMGGYYPLATNVAALKKHFKELPSTLLSARLRVLGMQDLVVNIATAGSKNGWQRTPKGKELMEAWQQRQ